MVNRNDQLSFARALNEASVDFTVMAARLRMNLPGPYTDDCSKYAIEGSVAIYEMLIRERRAMPSDELKRN